MSEENTQITKSQETSQLPGILKSFGKRFKGMESQLMNSGIREILSRDNTLLKLFLTEYETSDRFAPQGVETLENVDFLKAILAQTILPGFETLYIKRPVQSKSNESNLERVLSVDYGTCFSIHKTNSQSENNQNGQLKQLYKFDNNSGELNDIIPSIVNASFESQLNILDLFLDNYKLQMKSIEGGLLSFKSKDQTPEQDALEDFVSENLIGNVSFDKKYNNNIQKIIDAIDSKLEDIYSITESLNQALNLDPYKLNELFASKDESALNTGETLKSILNKNSFVFNEENEHLQIGEYQTILAEQIKETIKGYKSDLEKIESKFESRKKDYEVLRESLNQSSQNKKNTAYFVSLGLAATLGCSFLYHQNSQTQDAQETLSDQVIILGDNANDAANNAGNAAKYARDAANNADKSLIAANNIYVDSQKQMTIASNVLGQGKTLVENSNTQTKEAKRIAKAAEEKVKLAIKLAKLAEDNAKKERQDRIKAQKLYKSSLKDLNDSRSQNQSTVTSLNNLFERLKNYRIQNESSSFQTNYGSQEEPIYQSEETAPIYSPQPQAQSGDLLTGKWITGPTNIYKNSLSSFVKGKLYTCSKEQNGGAEEVTIFRINKILEACGSQPIKIK